MAPPANGIVEKALPVRCTDTDENVTSTDRASENGLSVSFSDTAAVPEGLAGESPQAMALSASAAATKGIESLITGESSKS